MPDMQYIYSADSVNSTCIYIYTFPSKEIGGFVHLCIDFVH